MTDPPRNTDTGVEPHSTVTTGTSRWQKVVGIIGLLVVLWIGNQMVGQLTGSGPGPGQHAPPAEIEEEETDTGDGDHQPPGDSDHQPPEDGP